MKLRKTQGAIILLGALAVLALGVGVAAAKSGKKKDKLPSPITEEEDEEEVTVIPPGPEGIPDGSVPAIQVLPPASAPFIPSSPPEEDFVPTSPPAAEDDPRGPDYQAPTPAPAAEPVSFVEAFVEEVLPPGTKPAPIAVAETKPAVDPNGTVLLARTLLARENLPNWKEDMREEVAAWQRKVGLKEDGLFGVVSATRMAEEVGILPLIRFWSKSYPTKKKALEDYSSKILGVAQKLQGFLPDAKAQILALGESVNRERGLTFGVNPKANPTLAEVEKINAVLAAEAQSEGKKELTSNA